MDMKRVKIFIVPFMLISFVPAAHAQDDTKTNGDVRIPPGMEIIKQGDVNCLVPKGSTLRRNGNQVFIEGADEYAARGFSERDNRLNKLEADLNQQKKDYETKLDQQNEQIEFLKTTVRTLEQRLNEAKDARDVRLPDTEPKNEKGPGLKNQPS
jgi:hypothetical protein